MHRVDDDGQRDRRLVRVARVVVDLDDGDAHRLVDLVGGDAGAVGGAHRVDEVVDERLDLRRRQLVGRQHPRRLAQHRVADGGDRRGPSLGPHPEHVAGRVAEVEAAAAGELEDRLGDDAAGGLDAGQGVLEVVGLEDDERWRAGRRRRGEAAVEAGALERRVLGAVVDEAPAEGGACRRPSSPARSPPGSST